MENYHALFYGGTQIISEKRKKQNLIPKKQNEGLLSFQVQNIVHVAAAGNHALYLLNDGLVYGLGGLKDLLGWSFDYVAKPMVLDLKNIVKIATDETHAVFLDKDGKVFVCGTLSTVRKSLLKGRRSGRKSPVGKIDKNTRPIDVSSIDGKIADVICGYKRVFFLTESGTCWVIGRNKLGECGVKSRKSMISKPKLIKFEKAVTIVKIACGYAHTLFLDSSGVVYCTGSNSYGQCGSRNVGDHVLTPIEISRKAFGRREIADVSCGKYHSVFLSRSENTCFVCGRNEKGCLGLGHNVDLSTPTRLYTSKFLQKSKIKKIYTGPFSSWFFSTNSELYATGSNYGAELGIGHTQKSFTPKRVKLSTKHNFEILNLAIADQLSIIHLKSDTPFVSRTPVPPIPLAEHEDKFAYSEGAVSPRNLQMTKRLINSVRYSPRNRKKSPKDESKSLNSSRLESKITNLEFKIDLLQQRIQALQKENSELKHENNQLKNTYSVSKEEEEFNHRKRGLKELFNMSIDHFVKKRDFQKCLDLQTVVEKLEQLTYSEESIKTLTLLEESRSILC